MDLEQSSMYIDCYDERERVIKYFRRREPVVLVGPTGCGKTTLVQELAVSRGCEIETVMCSPDMTLRHLVGGFVLASEGSVWNDGP